MRLFRSLSTGRMAAACARRPWLTIGIWALVLAVAVVLTSQLLGSAITSKMTFTRNPESGVGMDLLQDRMTGPEKAKEIVTVTSAGMTVDNPAFRGQVQQMVAGINGLGPDVVEGAVSFYQAGDPAMVSADRHTTIVPVVMAGEQSDAEKNIDALRGVTHAAAAASGMQIYTTGAASGGFDSNKLSEQDMQKSELIGILVALAILVVVFGALIATGLPLLLAFFSILIAIGITAIVGQGFQMSFFVVNMITMMGMAVGIDYSLFVVSRFREELARGRDRLTAIEIAGNTASRSVLFSGLTVILALAGMLIVPMSIFYSLALGAIFVVSVSMLAALTLLPAALRLLGGRINSIRVPFVSRYQGSPDGGPFWARISRIVMKRPVVSVLVAVVALAVPATFYFSINTGASGPETMPDSLESKQGFMVLARDFSVGLQSPVEVVIDGDAGSPALKQAIASLQDETRQDASFYGAGQVQVNNAGDLTLVSLPLSVPPTSNEASASIERLRTDYIPQAFNGTGDRVLVTGEPALNHDYFQMTDYYRPIVFLFVLSLSFILLMIVFHSLVVPLKAILMNLLSVGAAYGLIVLVFQKGVGASLFHFQQVASIEAWLPLFLFSVLFGLSMDYHVFLLGRIRENYQHSGDNTESVARGLSSTGRIITGAALIMVCVFSGFASGHLVMFQQMGFGLAVAVLLDATLVRCVLVPASMKLLGDWNWYLPRWLRWLPDFKLDSGFDEEGAGREAARAEGGRGDDQQGHPAQVAMESE